MTRLSLRTLGCATVVALLTAFFHPVFAGQPAAATATHDDSGYQIGPGDLLAITVFGEPDLSLDKVRVDATGTIAYPLLGEIKVTKETARQLESKLTTMLENGYLKKPEVSVSILEYRPFYVNGAVKSPGGYPYQEGLTIDKAIALAGGFSPRASKSKITLVRDSDPTHKEKHVGLATPVNPGDVINVGESLF